MKKNFIQRHFCWILWSVEFFLSLWILAEGRSSGLFGEPRSGMDQHTILSAARDIAMGVLPEPGKYLYSPAYTLFLGLLSAICNGKIIFMRIIQGAICAFIPVAIYRTGRRAGVGNTPAKIGAMLYWFCGSALLISLDFLRAAPLALICIGFYWSWLRAMRNYRFYLIAGALGGICMLGRENFIPVVFIPWAFSAIIPKWRKQITRKNFTLFLTGLTIILTPILSYNYYHTGSIAILPGNGTNVFEFMQGENTTKAPLQAAWQVLKKLPQTVVAIISPFENPNSLSIYAHRELLSGLKSAIITITMLFALGLIGVAAIRKKAIYLAAVIVAGYFGSLVFCEIYYRFRVPALPVLCILAAAGISVLSNWWCHSQWHKMIIGLLPLFLAIYWSITIDYLPRLSRSEREATVRILIDQGRFEQAEILLKRYRHSNIPSPAGERFLNYRRQKYIDRGNFKNVP